jgi:hypothetical protein
MKKLVVILALAVTLVGLVTPPAHAHGGDAALALAAFAAFNILFLPFTLAAAVIAPPVAYSPPVYSPPAYAYSTASYGGTYAAAPAAAPAPAPLINREVVYAHGRYVLYGDGVHRAFQWIWIPNPPPPGSAPGY